MAAWPDQFSGSIRPLLLLDVDGVLDPFPQTPSGDAEYRFFPEDDVPVRLNLLHGEWLRELAASFEIVWASAWGEAANELICPVFGLSSFPVVCLPQVPFEPRDKVPAVSAFAGERPAAWVEDIVTDEARAWADQRAAPTLILEVDSGSGLAHEHVEQLLTWARTLRSSPEAVQEPRPRRPAS